MKFPKAKKMTKRTIGLVHLAAASVWLSGFIALFALSLDGGASLGLTSADTQLTIEAFRRAVYPAPYGYGRSVWYLNTMGFRKARLARREMGTRRGCYRELRNSAIFNGLGWRGARMRNCALHDFRL